jgi:broad specificity phosphatase PhoE
VLRHGEVHNPGKVLYGRLPGYRLSTAGEAMAVAAAEWFGGHDITHLVSSPLERAQQTAAPLAKQLGMEVAIDERLIEAANSFEGGKFGLEGARFRRLGTSFLNRPATWVLLRNPFRPSWGEPYEDIAVRMLAAAAAAREAVRGHEAVCVSHQLPIWIARRRAEGGRLWHHPARRRCALASLTSFTYVGERLVSVSYHEPAAHLYRRPSVPGA